MRRSNEQTKEFRYSLDNIENLPKKKSTNMQKLLDTTELQYLYRFAKDNSHLLCLGNNLQRYVRVFDGTFLSENHDVYSFSNAQVYFSFQLVFYEKYPDALEYCNDTFFFNCVKSSSISLELKEANFLAVDGSFRNPTTIAVMKRFKKEMMLRNVAKCMNHPMMSTSFFQLFLRYLEQTPHLLWKVLTQLDSDPKEAYSCLYHGMAKEQNTFKDEPRNISEAVILHDIWKKKRNKPKWKTWTETQETQCLIHTVEMCNCQTIGLLVEKGAKIPVAAFKKAVDIGDETTMLFIVEKVQFCRREWYEVAQYAAEKVCEKPPSKVLVDILSSVILKTDVNADCSGIPPLIHHAVQSNNPKMLEMLLEGKIVNKGVSINRLYKQETPLTVATRLGYSDIAAILLDKKAHIGETEVFIACKEGRHEVLRLLVNRNPSLPYIPDGDGLTPLFHAVFYGHFKAVRVLLSELDVCQLQTDENTTKRITSLKTKTHQRMTRNGQTALHVAAKRGHTRIISLLLDHGFDVNANDYSNESPLSLACRERHTDAIRVILNVRNLQGHKQDETVVMRLVQDGDTELMQLFVEYGFCINFVNRQYGIPLHAAIKFGKTEMVGYLLSKGADPDIAKDGERAVHVAAVKGDSKSLKMLNVFGANIRAVTDGKGNDIIHLATEKMHLVFVETILQMSVSSRFVDVTNTKGETALHIAAKKGCSSLTKLLLQRGFNRAFRCKRGILPVVWAKQGLQRAISSKDLEKRKSFEDCVNMLAI